MINKVAICGKIVSKPVLSHEYNKKAFYKFNLSYIRPSGYKDVIMCLTSDLTNVKEGQYVCVSGRIVSRRNEHLEIFVSARYIDIIDNYYSNNLEMECFIVSDPIYSDRLKHNKKICKFLVACNNGNNSSYIPAFTYGIYAEVTKNCKIGDRIKGIGKLESRKTKNTDEKYDVIEICFKSVEVLEDESSNDK